MKQIGSLVLSAIIGSGITLGTYQYIDRDDKKVIQVEHVTRPPVVNAAYSVGKDGEIVPLDFTGAAEQVMPAVVHIKSTVTTANAQVQPGIPAPYRDFFGDEFFERFFGPGFEVPSQPQVPQQRIGAGSGVIINGEGYIVTNNHVINNADDIEVTLHDNRSYKAIVVGADPSTDLALIRIEANGLPYLPLANSDEVRVGEWVLAVGNPLNLNSTVTAGIVSAKARSLNILQDQFAIESFIQTDAAINMGNSGGALVNLQGGLVGINTAIASPTGYYSGYGFAVPSNIVSKVVEDLLEFGVVQRGILGVTIRGIDGSFAEEEDLKVNRGVYVDSVAANSAAAEAGIQKGDVILEVGGKRVETTPQLQELIARYRPGEEVEILADRNGRERKFNVKLKNREGKASVIEKSRREVLELLGAEFENVDKNTARELNINGGVRVSKLYAGKLRNNTKIKEGFIITSVDGKAINNIDELIAALESKKGGVLLEGIYENTPGKHYYGIGLE